jgi:hypothetical protein
MFTMVVIKVAIEQRGVGTKAWSDVIIIDTN